MKEECNKFRKKADAYLNSLLLPTLNIYIYIYILIFIYYIFFCVKEKYYSKFSIESLLSYKRLRLIRIISKYDTYNVVSLLQQKSRR